jgi:hypothetical protein
MAFETSYHIAVTKIAHEVIDGEAVVINLETGNYYGMTGISSQLWQWVAEGVSRREILDALAPLTAEQEGEVDRFLESLVAEGILEAGSGLHAAEPLAKYNAPYETPAFVKHNDMQNLLLSDPIHDVDETGWPHLDPGTV